MTCLPGLSWEYISWNIDLHRLQALNIEWEIRPQQSQSLKDLAYMVEKAGRFVRKKPQKALDPSDGEMVPLDPSMWKVVSHTSLGGGRNG